MRPAWSVVYTSYMKIRSALRNPPTPPPPPGPRLMPPDGCAPDITETNYVNIGYVVRELIRQFGPPWPPILSLSETGYYSCNTRSAISFFTNTCTVLVAGRSIGLMMCCNRRKWNLLVEQSTDDVTYWNHTLRISHVDGFQLRAIYTRKSVNG
jgi:hypothetical protein